jgi:periplasmic protein TonB
LDVRVTPTAKPPDAKPAPKAEVKTELPAPQRDESPPAEMNFAAPPDAKPQPASAEAANEPKPTPAPAPTATSSTTQTDASPPPAAPEKRAGAIALPQTSKPQPSSPQTSASPANESASKTPLNVGQLNSKALSLPKPSYPETARRMRLEGAVVVLVSIDASGKVISARAESGHMMLRGAAVTAARQARFAPTLVSGQPVPISGFIVYNFFL